jgi:hypothetical protein
MTDIEEWKQINNYENYEVSNLGNVRNSKTGRVLKLLAKGDMYLLVYVRIVMLKQQQFTD